MTASRALAAVNRTVKALAPALALSISASVPAPAKADYLAFLRTSIPSTWTVDAPHLRLIADHLDKIENGEIDRLAIHMPPRHGKTETVTVRYAAYCMERWPADNLLITGYNERIARRFSKKVRAIVEARGRVKLAPGEKAADEWSTVYGGTCMARGVGSPPTGVGFKRIIIDDPIRSREDADSETYRENASDWYFDDIYTRLEPSGAIVMINTRWHEDDVSARAVASEPEAWTVLSLPALAEENDPLGRKPGEALWPARYAEADLLRIKRVQTRKEGERSWDALYQQRPTAVEGRLFKPGNLRAVTAIPSASRLRLVRAWDLGSTTKGDYTVGALMGMDEKRDFFLLDIVRAQADSDERDALIRSTADDDAIRYGVGRVYQLLPQDPGAAGKAQAQAHYRLMAGHKVLIEPVTGDKETRAHPLASQVNVGNIAYLDGAAWMPDLREEMRAFPTGKHDDQVDACADAFNRLALWKQGFDEPDEPPRIDNELARRYGMIREPGKRDYI